MRSHEKPRFRYDVDLPTELANLRRHLRRADRDPIPRKTNQNVLIATWNLTNFGLQDRQEIHLQIMADILSRFDVVAVQEVADDLDQFDTLIDELGGSWDYLYTDVAGNQERLAYLYNARRVSPIGLAAELAMRSFERARIVIEEVEEEFTGFNRNPYMVTFAAGAFEFTLVNVHLYWTSFQLRQLEAKALAKWAKNRVKKDFPPNNDIILIGDFNMPRVRPGDEIYDQLRDHGIQLPKHTTNLIGTNLAGDADYDEIAFFPSRTDEDFTDRMGVFDFDNALFQDLYEQNEDRFFRYIRYYLADHRLLWAEFRRQ
ncbi:MAG: endonuclease/exonuclease/phosphatase family protein [Planctomycetota bacterium]|jgi:endonuclease/exonuclease/phosphatase family metal-dependent hydrolase